MREDPPVLGLRANWRQFSLLVVLNAFVGALVGLERTVLPLVAEAEFGIVVKSVLLSFLVTFGAVKAGSNLFAGSLADRLGRKRVLLVGWLVGLPVPVLLAVAPSWDWVVFANVLLGVNQGLCWSTTVIMKIDLVGPERRGLAMGLNEFAGYGGVSLMAMATGLLAAEYGLRPVPFLPGIALAVMGLAASHLLVRETRDHAAVEARSSAWGGPPGVRRRSLSEVFRIASWGDRALFSTSQAGLVNNLNDGVMWGLLPVFLVGLGLRLQEVAVVAAVYPGVWAAAQLGTGGLSDRWGRKGPIAAGMWVQAGGLGLFLLVPTYPGAVAAAAVLGLGTALVYPTLLAAVSDVAHPAWRASAVGVYRLWRDLGFVAGAVVAGLLADAYGLPVALGGVAALTFLSGVIVAGVMYETLSRTVPAGP